jgi:anti-anti-sigma regulatory factor/anti-sigma regulatory factor (Ser/Thr protein kinase)
MTLTATVSAESLDSIVLVTVNGVLTAETAPLLRRTLMKCLVQGPAAVIVELGALRVDRRSSLAVFPAALHAHDQPGTELILCGASAELAAQMDGRILGDIPSYTTYANARTAVTDTRLAPHRMTIRLAATPTAARSARVMITQACRSWQVEHLTEAATLVITELVANAVQHARTDLHVTAALRGEHLRLSVRDHSPQTTLPAAKDIATSNRLAPRGRGLRLVDFYSTAWGWHTGDGTKTVWATLQATPKRP